jgi:catechol 2,3-dioxygenase-like lactoylglutathione lyase family enzyme
MNSLAHIEINVSDLQVSREFYLKILTPLNWIMIFDCTDSVGFKGEDNTHIFLVQTKNSFIPNIFHRKNTGLNHLALRVESKKAVEEFNNFLNENNIPKLYTDCPGDYSEKYEMEEYYAIYFEDPDRIKLEVVFMK